MKVVFLDVNKIVKVKKLNAGLIGAGHLGKIHLRLLAASEEYNLVGFYDPDVKAARQLAEENGYVYFESQVELIDAVEVVDIVTPTPFHHALALECIKKGKHVFIEKPITQTVAEAEELIAAAKQYNVKGQVGHVERFNPAYKAVKDNVGQPMFIESHRLAEFNPRGTDVPVILDLMIHDIDIILSVIDSPIKSI